MEFLRETELEKYMLNKLNDVVREYIVTVYKPLESRHRKTIMVFTGDKYKPVDIITRFVAESRKKQNEKSDRKDDELGGHPLNMLRNAYEHLCDEYRRRLCAQWDIRLDNTWWIGDVVGDELAFDDEFVLSMTEVKHCVDNGVTYEQFDEYWRFCMREAEAGRDRARINFHSWFRFGCRPSHLCNAEGTEGREDAELSPGDRPADAHGK